MRITSRQMHGDQGNVGRCMSNNLSVLRFNVGISLQLLRGDFTALITVVILPSSFHGDGAPNQFIETNMN